METRIAQYSTSKFDLARVVAGVLEVSSLERLHEKLPGTLPRLKVGDDQRTRFHQQFYQSFGRVQEMYLEFVRHVLETQFPGTEAAYQRVPTFRVHLPGNIAVGEFHSDAKYGHGAGEVNIWVPLVDAVDTRTLWLESGPDIGDFQPVAVNYGEYLVFDGVNLKHGNVTNTTGSTRVSFDFRLADMNVFVPRTNVSVASRMRFDLDEYFARF